MRKAKESLAIGHVHASSHCTDKRTKSVQVRQGQGAAPYASLYLDLLIRMLQV